VTRWWKSGDGKAPVPGGGRVAGTGGVVRNVRVKMGVTGWAPVTPGNRGYTTRPERSAVYHHCAPPHRRSAG